MKVTNQMIRSISHLLLFAGFLLINSCSQRQLVFSVNDVSLQYPQKVFVFLDYSASMQGFFNTNRSDAIELISNIYINLDKKKVELTFYQFGNNVSKISDKFDDFHKRAFNPSFYNGSNNLYSIPLDSIAKMQKANPRAAFLIFTDGVVSAPGNQLTKEKARIKTALARNHDQHYTMGLFQYRFAFNGKYYAQPHETEVNHQGKRNFFALSIAPSSYDNALQRLMVFEDKLKNAQNFRQKAYQRLLQVPEQCNPQLIANDQLHCTIEIESDKVASLSLAKLTESFVLTHLDHTPLKGVTCQVNQVGNKIQLHINFSKSDEQVKGKYLLKLNEKVKSNNDWVKILYPNFKELDEEPRVDSLIRHEYTFRLDILLDAFEFIYQDSPVFEIPLEINKYKSMLGFAKGIYTIPWGEQIAIDWLHSVYFILFLLFLITPTIPALFFYKVHLPIVENSHPAKRKRLWYGWALINFLVVAISSFLAIYTLSGDGCPNLNSETVTNLKHSLYNAGLATFILLMYSVLLKRSSLHLRDIPF